jgi:hypothetical protein
LSITKSIKQLGIENRANLIGTSFLSILASLFISTIITFLLWISMKSVILWLNLISIKSLITISTFTAVGFCVIMLLVILFQKDSRATE